MKTAEQENVLNIPKLEKYYKLVWTFLSKYYSSFDFF